VKGIKRQLTAVKTILGVSNISISLADYPRPVHGLDMAIVNYTKICSFYKIPHEQIELVRQQIFRDETNGDPLQKYIPHFLWDQGQSPGIDPWPLWKTYRSMTS
jgi:cobalamin-dependent methionine synthase I